MNSPRLVLASASLRRQELLQQIGVQFEISAQDIDESQLPGEGAEDLVCRLAEQKARSCLQQHGATEIIALGSDTVVVHQDRIMGQPRDREEAAAMLATLSGSQHQVLTAIALARGDELQSRLSITQVSFRPISNEEIQAYWETGEPTGKAGAYAIQGYAAVFVESIEGSYSGVMGLPLYETAQLLADFGVDCWHPNNGIGNE